MAAPQSRPRAPPAVRLAGTGADSQQAPTSPAPSPPHCPVCRQPPAPVAFLYSRRPMEGPIPNPQNHFRVTLISHLREALNEQELKVAEVRSQLQAAQPHYKKANELCQKLGIDVHGHQPSNEVLKKSRFSEMPITGAADVVTKFGASVAPEKIPPCVLASLANRMNLSQEIEHHSSGHKRKKVEDDTYISPLQWQQPSPLPPFQHPGIFQPPPPEYPPSPPPPPPTSVLPIAIPHTHTPPSTLHQKIYPIPPVSVSFVRFPVGPPSHMTRMPYGTFPPYTPIINLPMTNMSPGFSGAPNCGTFPPYTSVNLLMTNMFPGFPGAPNPPPAFQGSRGTLYGPPPYPTAPPPTNWK